MKEKYPFYIRSTVILLGLTLLVYMMAHLGDILVPLILAVMLAILLNPLHNWLLAKKIPRIISICICLSLAMVVLGGTGYFVSSQLASFTTDMPLLKEKMDTLFSSLQRAIDDRLGIDVREQNEWLDGAKGKLEPLAGSLLSGIFGSLSILLLLPVYTFLILYYKKLLLNFLYESFAEKNSNEVAEVLAQTKQSIQNFMSGLLLEALIVAIMNTVALMIIGVKYALLIGVIGALLNMLPYIGGLIAIAIPLVIATITQDGFSAQLWIIGSYLVIQFIDNNFLMPYIVSSKVKINALVSIVMILLGGALWGISGMFLSIPITGLVKIIFDRIPELQHWGKLLGTEMPRKVRKFRNKATTVKTAA